MNDEAKEPDQDKEAEPKKKMTTRERILANAKFPIKDVTGEKGERVFCFIPAPPKKDK